MSACADGVYDNKKTMRREFWKGGKVVEFISAEMLTVSEQQVKKSFSTMTFRSFGSFPDVDTPAIIKDVDSAIKQLRDIDNERRGFKAS